MKGSKKELGVFIEEICAIYNKEKQERKMAHFTDPRFNKNKAAPIIGWREMEEEK